MVVHLSELGSHAMARVVKRAALAFKVKEENPSGEPPFPEWAQIQAGSIIGEGLQASACCQRDPLSAWC